MEVTKEPFEKKNVLMYCAYYQSGEHKIWRKVEDAGELLLTNFQVNNRRRENIIAIRMVQLHQQTNQL